MTETEEQFQSPDLIAHILATNIGNPVQIYLEDSELTVPLEPSDGGAPPATTFPCNSFSAMIDDTIINDWGLVVDSRLQLSEPEWRRIGLEKHWNHDKAIVNNPSKRRRLEVTAGRDELIWGDHPEKVSFDHLDPIPGNSPLITEWKDPEGPSKPPIPLSRPYVWFYAARTEGVTETHGANRIEIGNISAVKPIRE